MFTKRILAAIGTLALAGGLAACGSSASQNQEPGGYARTPSPSPQ